MSRSLKKGPYINVSLEKINRYGTTVILTTHNVEIVNRLKRRVITVDHGKITSDQAQGSYRQ